MTLNALQLGTQYELEKEDSDHEKRYAQFRRSPDDDSEPGAIACTSRIIQCSSGAQLSNDSAKKRAQNDPWQPEKHSNDGAHRRAPKRLLACAEALCAEGGGKKID